jgi:hypothetical protein
MTATSAARPDERYRWATWLILLSVALAGVAHVAFLPPFEDFDEVAHWSSIQQIADTGRIPRSDVDRLSADVEAYPGPYAASGHFPPGLAGGRVFKSFFADPALPDLRQPVTRLYQPGRELNWEAQHPPLYYLLLTPFYTLARDWSWPTHMLLLRLVSWSIAFAGLVIGCRPTQRTLSKLRAAPVAGLLVPAWPLLFPQFFPEFARLGNDSLCLLLIAVAWRLILRGLGTPDSKTATGLGVSLGFGLLTKAFFWPIGAGCIALFVFAAWRETNGRYLAFAAIVLGVALAIGGGWYIRNLVTTGFFFGAIDFIRTEQAGGMFARLRSGFGLEEITFILRNLLIIAGSFAWAGTWTLAMLPRIFTAPLVLLAALPLALWLRDLKQWPVLGLAPLFLATPVLAGLIYHAVDQATLGDSGMPTPGWYLHILAGPLAFAIALGWRWRRLFAGLTVYAISFQVICWATQLSVFSGCAYKPGPHLSLTLDAGSCLIVPSRLAVLGEPLLGSVALAMALIAGMAGLFLTVRRSALSPPVRARAGMGVAELPIRASR